MRVALVVVLAGLAAAAGASAQRTPAHPCKAALRHGPMVPAPIVLWSDCGVFRLERDGHVLRLPRRWLARHGSGTGRRYGADLRLRWTREGAFFLVRRGHEVWRSTGTYRDEGSGIAYGPGLFAFASYRRGVFLTDLEGPERLVVRGRGLFVAGFTRRGEMLVIGGGDVVVVSPAGEILRRISYRPRRGFAFDQRTDTAYLVTRSYHLAVLRGPSLRTLRPVPDRSGYVTLEKEVLVWYGARSVTVTDREGALLASARWPRSYGSADLGVRASADGRLFVFRLSTGKPGGRADQRLVLLRAWERDGRVVLRHRLESLGCGVPGGMSWHGHRLLYRYGDRGRATVLDADSGDRTSLTSLVRAIPRRASVEAVELAWAGDFSR